MLKFQAKSRRFSMELRGYPTNHEALVTISSEELDLIMKLAAVVNGRRQPTEADAEAAEDLYGSAEHIYRHMPAESLRSS
jgi:hypothetical protein